MLTTHTEPTTAERRAYSRFGVDYRATVRLLNGTSAPCRVRNISPMGAMFELEEPLDLPRTFRLLIPAELFAADCELRHQTGNSAGVVFTSGRLEALARFS